MKTNRDTKDHHSKALMGSITLEVSTAEEIEEWLLLAEKQEHCGLKTFISQAAH